MSLTRHVNREMKIRGVIDKDRRGRGMEVAISQDHEACCSIVPIAGIQMPALCLPVFTSGIILCEMVDRASTCRSGIVVRIGRRRLCTMRIWLGLAWRDN